jgi:hypothetical protein
MSGMSAGPWIEQASEGGWRRWVVRSLDSLSFADFAPLRHGGPKPPLPQRIYRVEHDLGAIEIFLVPIASDRYEAVFT